MTRRTLGLLITLAFSFLWSSLTVAALPPGKMPRIGVLAFGSPPISPDWKARSPFFQELRTLGWLEGQNIMLEYRWAEGQASRLSPLAAELVRLPVDVIVVADTPAIRTAQHATTTIPIVMVSVGDPVAMGFVADLARPGGNMTGVGGKVPELSGKLLELLMHEPKRECAEEDGGAGLNGQSPLVDARIVELHPDAHGRSIFWHRLTWTSLEKRPDHAPQPSPQQRPVGNSRASG